MLRNAFVKTLRDARRAIGWWSLGLIAMTALMVAVYPSVRDNPDLNKMVEDYPDAFKAFLGLGENVDYTSAVGYLNSELFAFMVPLLMLIAAVFTYALNTAGEAFQLLLSVGAGTGLLYLLRWFWWRINAWCEIVAMVVSFGVAMLFFVLQKNGVAIESTTVLLATVSITSVAWIVTALVTKPTDRSVLITFYRTVRPSGPGWRDGTGRARVARGPHCGFRARRAPKLRSSRTGGTRAAASVHLTQCVRARRVPSRARSGAVTTPSLRRTPGAARRARGRPVPLRRRHRAGHRESRASPRVAGGATDSVVGSARAHSPRIVRTTSVTLISRPSTAASDSRSRSSASTRAMCSSIMVWRPSGSRRTSSGLGVRSTS